MNVKPGTEPKYGQRKPHAIDDFSQLVDTESGQDNLKMMEWSKRRHQHAVQWAWMGIIVALLAATLTPLIIGLWGWAFSG